MKKFEIIEHTADIGAKIYGSSLEELFLNSAVALYKLMGISYNNFSEKLKVEIDEPTVEDLLVKFLNELIFYVDAKKVAGNIKNLKIKKLNEDFFLGCEIEGKKIKKIEREIKSATYHGLKVEKKENFYTVTIIFDI